MLVDRAGGPAFWPNVFVTSRYYIPGRSPATQKKVLICLGMARMWGASLNRILDDELAFGRLPSVADVTHLADFLGLTARSQEVRFAENQSAPAPASKMRRNEDFRPDGRALAASRYEAAPADEVATRIRYVSSYIQWHLDIRLGRLHRDGRDTYELREAGLQVTGLLKQRIPPKRGDHDEVALEGVSDAVVAALEEILRPDSPRNPFRHGFVRARNYLAWCLYRDTGARRSEVRHAKVDHITYATKRFRIEVSKTMARTVPIGEDTAEAFDAFIIEQWARLPQAARAKGHLFTDLRGRLLSERAFNRIFEAARKVDPTIPVFTSPHTIRRTWNDNFSRTVDSLPPDKRPPEEREVQMRNTLMGWKPESKMGAKYAQRHIKKKADELSERMLLDLVTREEDDDG